MIIRRKMMSKEVRLIDANALIEHTREFTNINAGYFENPELLERVIKHQPTVYDMEKVVAELEDRFVEQNGIRTQYHNNAIGIALKIVRNGGKE